MKFDPQKDSRTSSVPRPSEADAPAVPRVQGSSPQKPRPSTHDAPTTRRTTLRPSASDAPATHRVPAKGNEPDYTRSSSTNKSSVPQLRRLVGLSALLLVLILLLIPQTLQALLSLLFPGQDRLVYPLASPFSIAAEHLGLVLLTSGLAALAGFASALLAYYTRSQAAVRLLTLTGTVVQTVPPMAVLALLVPLAGFGTQPVIYALVIFGVLPVFHYSLAALSLVPASAIEAARGLGFGPLNTFARVELPLAAPGILTGIKTSVLINIGTATIGATMGSGGLGRPIIAGMTQFIYPYLVQGALTAAILALIADSLFSLLQHRLKRATPG